ncbi:acyl-CoA thioester hydrolase [Novosphingobium hassiacum]|uniref:Acyl-CoA thioester hydrolase n=1 Tax=Novosphingobium hassiacum TaxID=173676 RepID=A0A7W6EVD1_9SPHN|nr:acyl-CoA thioesterase [Novosphingobium hassiacum]MBB3860163.1 acyl-CoA thioester hydrolase [Novosphingobium hassiacum]
MVERPPARGRAEVVTNRHALTFTAAPEHIDELGHVNNAVWLQWVQDIAVAHWDAVASDAHKAAYVWVVTRHEIDYRGNIGLGQSVRAETFIPEAPTGARFDRRVDFTNDAGKVIVSARTTWALLDRASGRLLRVPKDVAAPFLP